MRCILSLLLLVCVLWVRAQHTDYPLHHKAYEIIDKWQTRSTSQMFTAVKPFRRYQPKLGYLDNPLFNKDINYLQVESREYLHDSVGRSKRPILNHLYRYKNDFFSYRDSSFDLHINPVWQFQLGKDSEIDELLFTNSRGLEVRGTIDKKVAFYSRFTENQILYPGYVKAVADSIGVIPYEGFWKELSNERTTDFFRATGYVDFGLSPHISAQVGFGKHFIGNGQRSLLLSDYGNSYPYVRISTEIWKFKYTNLFAQLIADVFTFDGGTLGASRYPKKFMAAHYLDLAITPKINLGFFESIIFGKPDSLGGSKVKLEYLNPLIFYRAIEQQDGSADNAVLGADLRWSIHPKLMVYGQFILDELIVSEVFAGDNWWGNKYGYQLGGKFFDFPLANLDLQAEYNWARPFTYAHDNFFTSYTHYRQPLAHPLGANFDELLLSANWKATDRLSFKGTILSANYGLDDESEQFSVGQDPNRSYNLRANEYGQTHLQGNQGALLLSQFIGTFHWKHNFFWDILVTYRKETFDRILQDRTSVVINAGFRWNMPRRNYWF